MNSISIVIPCYKSEKTISCVVSNLEKFFLNNTQYEYQIILVNDGSNDNTFPIISKLCKTNSRIIGINLSRNFGQASARMAGIQYAIGDIVICMDDDGQHPIERIPDFICEIENGFDVVYAKFVDKKTSKFKIVTSHITRSIYEKIGIIPKGIYVSSYFAINGEYLDVLRSYSSPFPSIGSFLFQYTSSFKNIDMIQKKQISGNSRYHLDTLFQLFFNSITNFSSIPVHMITRFGGVMGGIGIIAGLCLIVSAIFRASFVNGFICLSALMLFLGGSIIFSIGFIGEFVCRIYMDISSKPQYYVAEIINERMRD